MWVPDFLPSLWPDSEPDILSRSESDKTERPFEVSFQLADSISLKVSVPIHLEKVTQIKQTDGFGKEADIWFRPDDSKRLEAITMRVAGTNADQAYRYAREHLSALLSLWAVQYGIGILLHRVVVLDTKSMCQWRLAPKSPSPEALKVPRGIGLGRRRSSLLALYREARNSRSVFYRFLCCYKILEARYTLKQEFGEADRKVKELGLELARPKRKITQDLLVTSLVFDAHPEFQDVPFGRFFELLNPWRIKVAHAVTDEGEFLDIDDFDTEAELGSIANLTDQVARQVLLDEIDLWKAISASSSGDGS